MEDNESGGPPGRTRRRVLTAAGALGASAVAGCVGAGDPGTATDGDGGGADGDETGSAAAGGGSGSDGTPAPAPETAESGPSGSDPTPADNADWRSVELETVRDGETFTVDGFDRPVVLEAFAVWCPKCTRQQEELHGLDDSVVAVSLNTDPNEDAEKVRAHAEDHGFDWRYAVAPPEMTQSLVDAFGTTVTNAPSTPVVVACPDGGASFFAGSGTTDVPTIEATAGNC
jgi:hypothetical protein